MSEQQIVMPMLYEVEETNLLELDSPHARHRYTAESLERNVAKRDAILRALAENHGLHRIARAFGVSHHLVSALRDSRPELVATEKKMLSRSFGRVIRLCLERFEEGVVNGKVHPGQLPVALGIFSDKKAQLDGDPTMVVEHRQQPTIQQLNDYFESMTRVDVEEVPRVEVSASESVSESKPPFCAQPAQDDTCQVANYCSDGGGGIVRSSCAADVDASARSDFRAKA